MNLGEARVGEERAFLVSAIRGGDVAAACVRRQIENVSVAAGGEHHCVGGVSLYLSGDEIASDYSFGVSVHEHDIEHLRLWKHLHRASGDLPRKGLVGAEKKLLAGLSPRIKGS